MQSPTMKDAVMRAYKMMSDAYSYLEKLLLDVTEALGILLVLEFFGA